jgi:hypothetical protein
MLRWSSVEIGTRKEGIRYRDDKKASDAGHGPSFRTPPPFFL